MRTLTLAGRSIWWHWQNLNDRPGGGQGSWLRHSRAWLHWGNACWRVSWNWWGLKWLGLNLETGGDENDVSISVHLGVVSFWFGVEGLLPYGWLDRKWPATTGITLSTGTGRWPTFFRLHWRCQDWCWPHEKGWSYSCHLEDKLLGRAKYSVEILSVTETRIPMPEQSYPATVTMERATWRRSRWPFPRVVLRAKVDIPDGVPVPGKGTEAYNCGPDAIYGLTTSARDVEEAVGKVVESALRDRRRYPL